MIQIIHALRRPSKYGILTTRCFNVGPLTNIGKSTVFTGTDSSKSGGVVSDRFFDVHLFTRGCSCRMPCA